MLGRSNGRGDSGGRRWRSDVRSVSIEMVAHVSFEFQPTIYVSCGEERYYDTYGKLEII